MQETAARGAVMAGAEREAGLDLDRDVVGADKRAVMRAMHEKTPGAHRLKPGERARDPVALRRQAERRRARGLASEAASISARTPSSSGAKPK